MPPDAAAAGSGLHCAALGTIGHDVAHAVRGAPTEGVAVSDPSAPQTGLPQFPITTALEFPEWATERYVGMVFGLVVRSMGAAKGFTAGFRAIAGGEVKQYTKLLEDSRRHALDRMIENAQLLGANAVVQFRFDGSEIGQSLTEIVAYGTGVVIGPRQ